MDTGISIPHNLVLWKIKIPTKIRIFLWVASQDKLLTQQNLWIKGCSVPIGCHLCANTEMETTGHLLYNCPFANRLWQLLVPLLQTPNQTEARSFICSDGLQKRPCQRRPKQNGTRRGQQDAGTYRRKEIEDFSLEKGDGSNT